MQRGLPDLIERRPLGVGPGRRSGQLLPTPTSGGGTGYLSGNHRDTWRPTLELAVQGYRPSKLGRTGRPEVPALLPTPTARAYGSNQSLSAGAAVRPSLASLAARRLLPTPRTSDACGPAHHGGGGSDLQTVVWLLPTPKATDGTKGCPAQRGSKGDLTLPSAAVGLDAATADGADDPTPLGRPPAEPRLWGPYAGAVARWEYLIGRPAPAPTQSGIHGKPVLAPPFVEWLMGLDEGFVTELGLPRTLALRVLGNGVVPQQAAAALRLLLCPHRWAVNP